MIDWHPITEDMPAVALPDKDRVYAQSDRILLWIANGGEDGKGAACFGWFVETAEGKDVWVIDGYGAGRWKVTHWAGVNRP